MAKDSHTITNLSAEVMIPNVPAFLRVKSFGADRAGTLPIESFTDEQLKAVGEQWTQNLIDIAKANRNKPTPR